MKKLYLAFLLFIFGVISFSETYTKSEQREIIKQFAAFQSALRGKNFDKTENVLVFPLSYSFEDKESAFENKNEFFKSLKDLTLQKVDTKTNKISTYTKKGNSKTCDFEVSSKVISSNDDLLNEYGMGGEKSFAVFASYFSSSPEITDMCSNYDIYFFQLENKKLKLIKKVELP